MRPEGLAVRAAPAGFSSPAEFKRGGGRELTGGSLRRVHDRGERLDRIARVRSSAKKEGASTRHSPLEEAPVRLVRRVGLSVRQAVRQVGLRQRFQELTPDATLR